MAKSYKRTIVLGLDYSEFEGGVTKCNSAMKKLDAEFALASERMKQEGTETDKLALKKDYLTQKIHVQNEKVENAEKKYNKLADSLGYAAKETEKADVELLKARTELQKLENQLAETEDNLDKFESELEENTKELENFEQATENAGKGGETLTKVTTAATAAFVALTAAQAKATMEAAEWADEMTKLSENTGVCVETLQVWSTAAEKMNVPVDAMTGAVSELVNKMGEARENADTAKESFGQLGLKVTDSSGKLKDAETMFYQVIDRLKDIEDKTERDVIAMKIFGESAQELSGIIALGSEGIGEMAKRFEELGLTLSSDEIAKLKELDDSFESMKATMSSVGKEIAVDLAPALTALFTAISEVNPAVLQFIAITATTVTGLIAAVAAFNTAKKGVDAVKNVFTVFSGTVDTTTAKILLLVTAVGLAAAAIAVLVGRGKELNDAFSNVNGTISSVGQIKNSSQRYHAIGTQYFEGGRTWVGEHGPEVVDLPRGTRIYNNQESKSITNSPVYNVTVVADMSKIRSVQDVVDIIQGIPQSAGTGGAVLG